MKKLALFICVFCLFVCAGCGSDGGGRRPPVQEDKVIINPNMTSLAVYTYSLSNPPSEAGLFPGFIGFSVGVIKDNSSISIVKSDITWTSTGDNVGALSPVPGSGTGAYLTLNNSTGTAVVKATYLAGTIDEMLGTVTIHVVP